MLKLKAMLITAGGFLLTLLIALLAVFSARAKQAKAERDQARQQADIATEVNATHKRIDAALQKANQKHQQEEQHEKDQLKNNDRSQLDRDW